jgi:Predicted transcriptional regulators
MTTELATPAQKIRINSVTAIPPTEIDVDFTKNFSRFQTDDASIDDLAYSMFTNGQDTPCEVRKDGNTIQLVAGFRRYLAGIKITEGFSYTLVDPETSTTEEVRVHNENFRLKIISSQLTDTEAFRKNVRENVERRELSHMDLAAIVKRAKTLENMTNAEIASILGCTVPQIYNLEKLNDLPKAVQEMVHRKEVPMTSAVLLVGEGLKKTDILNAVEDAMKTSEGLSIKKAKDIVRQLRANSVSPPTSNGNGTGTEATVNPPPPKTIQRSTKEVRESLQNLTAPGGFQPVRKLAKTLTAFVGGSGNAEEMEKNIEASVIDSGVAVLEYLKKHHEGKLPDGVKFPKLVQMALKQQVADSDD